MSRLLSADVVTRLAERLTEASERKDWHEVDSIRRALSHPEKRAMGFYDVQAVQTACWESRDAGSGDLPMLSATKVLELVEEIWRLRGLVHNMKQLTQTALPDHRT